MHLHTIALIVALTVLSGCDHAGVVDVVDPAGKPLGGAAIAPVTASMNGTAVMTDGQGETHIATSIGGQPAQWVSVSKAGYTSKQVAVPATWPLHVALMPTAPSQPVAPR